MDKPKPDMPNTPDSGKNDAPTQLQPPQPPSPYVYPASMPPPPPAYYPGQSRPYIPSV